MADQARPLRKLWNIGAKVTDVESEVAFLERLGGRRRLHENLPGPNGPIEYAFVDIAQTRVLLTPTPVYEAALGRSITPGWAHAVFTVGDDHAAECARIEQAGAKPLTEPRQFEAAFGRRDVAFFQSPGGLIFEALHIIEDRMD